MSIGWRWDSLKVTERKVAELLVQGKRNKEIARELDVPLNRAQDYIRRVVRKVGADGTRSAINLLAEELHLVLLTRFLDACRFGAGIAQDGIAKYVNPSLARMLNYSVDEMIGQPISNMFASNHVELMRRHQMRMRGQDRLPTRLRVHLRRGDGSTLSVHACSGLIRLDGKPAALSFFEPLAPYPEY